MKLILFLSLALNRSSPTQLMDRIRCVDRLNYCWESHMFMLAARRWKNPTVFLDTEFPGTIYRSAKPYTKLSLDERYALLKKNVDELKLIQVGITLCHPTNNLTITWQFNICDFDVRYHVHTSESIALLSTALINLEETRRLGVPSSWLVRLLLDAGLIGPRTGATWVTFHGCYDYAFLIRAFIELCEPPLLVCDYSLELPMTLGRFLELTSYFFGSKIYDVKWLMTLCHGLHGGLERVAGQLGLKRAAGKSHQAGSDSMLTCQVFFRIKKVYFNNGMNVNGKMFPWARICGEERELPGKGVLFSLAA